MKALVLVSLLALPSGALAVDPPVIEAQLGLSVAFPLSGAKTLLRFEVTNFTGAPIVVYEPFANQTRLVVVHPDGQRREHFNWKEMPGPPAPLSPGLTFHWDVDIAQWVDLNQEGTYLISFSVNGLESDHVIFVRD